jgi:hypothetical protein
MTMLVPMDGVLGSVAKVADRDPAAAAVLVQLGMFEALTEQIEAVRTPMTKAVLRNMDQVAKSARRRLERTVVAKGEAPEGYAQALDVIDDFVAKGLLGTLIGGTLAAFNREHPRDQKGRFVTMEAKGAALPESAKMDDRAIAHSGELVGHRDRMKQAKLIDDDTEVHVGVKRRIKAEGKKEELGNSVRYFPMKAKDLEDWTTKHGADNLPVELQVRRSNLKDVSPAQLAAIDLTQLATGEDFMGARKLTRGIFDDDGGKPKKFGDAEAKNWYGATEGTDRQTYRRAKTLGQGLSAGAPAGHPVNTVGNLAQLMGDLGPEAEKVLGPGIRRTAYRYRGTERRPERDLYEAVGRATELMNDYNDAGTAVDQHGRTRSAVGASNIARQAADDPKARRTGDYAAKIAATYATQDLSDDERDLLTRGGVAVASLLGYGHGTRTRSRLPDMQLTELSLASGEAPPSEGVIIDANGHVVSQAVGYNGDHYLPFDLRNLGRLHGGQYVRTRASGGPTTEDIYTSLVTGTRQIQVVSNSGVFTMEFDPDLRGVRRFNDKVSRMVERYGSMLAAIHDPQSELYENDLPPETMRTLRDEASEEARTKLDYDKRLGDKIREARWRAEAESTSWEEIEQWARSQAEAQVRETHGERLSPTQKESLVEEAKNTFIDNETPSVRKLRLDGGGYFRAMRALQQEFPYYIRNVDFRPLPEWLKEQGLRTMGYRRGAPSDKAYVAPGQTNTAAAMVGGSRSARRVRTGHDVKGLTAAQATYGSTRTPLPKTTSEPTPNAPATPGTQDSPGAQRAPSAGGGSNEPDQVDYTSLLGSKQRIAFGLVAGIIKGNAPSGIPEDEMDDDAVMRLAPRVYAHRIMSTVGSQSGAAGKALTTWMDTKDQRHRMALLEGIKDYYTAPEMKDLFSESDPQTLQTLEDTYNQLVTYDDMVHPFAETPEGENPEGLAPEVPKPFALPIDVPQRNAPEQDWEVALKRLNQDYGPEFGSGAFTKMVDTISTLDREKRFEYVTKRHDAMTDKIALKRDEEAERTLLALAHRSWTFVQARENAERWRELVGGDDDPKAVGKSDLPLPAGDPFLLRLRAELDQMIADGLVAPG